jgi:catechol 2,3-dioxygenase-like lactoylglutathione lyase family enzyme
MTNAPEAKLDLNLRVADLESSIRWYETMFGTPPLYRGDDRSLDGRSVAMACFRIGGVKVWLLPGSTGKGDQRVGIALMVRTPLGPLRASLAMRGARFDDHPMPGFPIDADGIRQGKDAEFFYLLDPDDHRIEYCRILGGQS